MSCKLQRVIPPGAFDFVTQNPATVTVFADSDSATVHLVAASLNGNPIPVSVDHTKFTTIAGINILNLAFAAANPDEVFRIKEDCGGSSQVLELWRLRPGPAGEPGDPAKGFRIYAKP